MIRMACLGVVAAVTLSLSMPAQAQDASLPPSYGTVDLRSGFIPDPHVIEVMPGGFIDAEGLGDECDGTIANAPDVELVFDAGKFPLWISVLAEADTTLVVQAPDGRYLCNDDNDYIDFLSDMDDYDISPALIFAEPMAGRYAIWVGMFDSEEETSAPARLMISEVGPFGRVLEYGEDW